MNPKVNFYFMYSLFLVLLLFTSCNGQVKENPSKEKVMTNIVQAKLPKAKGVFEAASIDCALQDKAGNFWFGTNGEGLFRYDGKTFTNFTEKDGLGSPYVYSLLEDKIGDIWIGTRSGLCRYDGKSFTTVSLVSKDVGSTIWSMMQDKKGTIWFGADEGVHCFDGTSFTFFLDHSIINNDSLYLKGIFSFLEDKKGNIWFGSCIGEGLIRFDGKFLKRISPKGYARTQGLVEDSNGNIWFASVGKGMCQFNGSSINTNFFREKDTYDLMYTILKDKDDHLWFSEPSNSRALRYYNGNELINFSERDSFPNEKMYPILEDNAGNIWLSAEGMKLYRWNGKTFSDFSE